MSFQFPSNAVCAEPVFYKSYSRLKEDGTRETWEEVCDRTQQGLFKLGKFTPEEENLISEMQRNLITLPSGRWLWVGGTPWLDKPANWSGAFNCTSTEIVDWESFRLLADMAMQGTGTGAVLEQKNVEKLPEIRNLLNVTVLDNLGEKPASDRMELTYLIEELENNYSLIVGDSRQGWTHAYKTLMELASDAKKPEKINLTIDFSNVRPKGERLKGFGGISNPLKLPEVFIKVPRILNKAIGRKLTSVECCLVIDEMMIAIVAGNVRRSANIKQFSKSDQEAAECKLNLWQPDDKGNWKIDPEKDALRLSNHTRVFHKKPTLEECIESVKLQHGCGEGAIQYAPEAIARGNADIIRTPEDKKAVLDCFELDQDFGESALFQLAEDQGIQIDEHELNHRMVRYGLNPCVTADTWVHTEEGARQVKDLIGKQISVHVNGDLFSTTPEGFWSTGVKPVFKVITQEGYEVRLTENHKLLKLTAQTQNKQYFEWAETKDLSPGDRIFVHNHRQIKPWDSFGTLEEGWLIGSLIGDGSIASTEWGDTALLRYWGDTQEEIGEHAVSLLRETVGYAGFTKSGHYHKQNKNRVVQSVGLARLASEYGVTLKNKMPTSKIEKSSYDFHRGFLRGLFDADGSVQGSQKKGISIRLAQSNLNTLQIVQRMLARLGIISTIYQERRGEGYRSLPDSDRQPALYFCKTQHELVIANDNIYTFHSVVGFKEPHKADRLNTLISNYKRKLNRERFVVRVKEIVPEGVEEVFDCTVPAVSQFDANGIVAHNCGEIIGSDFHCNLGEVHLNQISPQDMEMQEKAFRAGALTVSALLMRGFAEERYQKARELDPIVGVSFTGLFDFFVKLFGNEWLRWWAEGRPESWKWSGNNPFLVVADTPETGRHYPDQWNRIRVPEKIFNQYIPFAIEKTLSLGETYKIIERLFLQEWSKIVHKTVKEYCSKHEIKCPNRCTTVQPAGTKSLLSNASPGWHPPKAQYYIRRVTMPADDPIALACLDYGYNIVPSQSCKDKNGNLLNDPYDERVWEWLIEIPTAVNWADDVSDDIDPNQFSAIAQFDFYMQVQKYYTTHNTSATIELRSDEIEPLAEKIYQAIQNNDGYISSALLARFDDFQSFPRLPFEPITKEKYLELSAQVSDRRKNDDFNYLINQHTPKDHIQVGGAAPCDSDKCLMS